MALSHSPYVVTDNLFISLDAANKKNYAGTGTSWINYKNSAFEKGFLVGNVTYSEFPNKFDINATGVTQENYLSFLFGGREFSITDAFPYSMDFWFKLSNNAQSTFHSLAGWNSTHPWISFYKLTESSWYIRYRDFNAVYNDTSVVNSDPTQWMNITLTADNSRNVRVYFNSNLLNTLTPAITTFYLSRIAGGYASGGNFYSLQGSIALFKLYSKTLFQEEITQNFNAIRGRFGI